MENVIHTGFYSHRAFDILSGSIAYARQYRMSFFRYYSLAKVERNEKDNEILVEPYSGPGAKMFEDSPGSSAPVVLNALAMVLFEIYVCDRLKKVNRELGKNGVSALPNPSEYPVRGPVELDGYLEVDPAELLCLHDILSVSERFAGRYDDATRKRLTGDPEADIIALEAEKKMNEEMASAGRNINAARSAATREEETRYEKVCSSLLEKQIKIQEELNRLEKEHSRIVDAIADDFNRKYSDTMKKISEKFDDLFRGQRRNEKEI